MQTELHPAYQDVQVKCSCGSLVGIRSTLPSTTLNVEVCSKCHPFYTGKQKIVDTAGRVDKFRRRFKQDKREEGNAEAA